MGIFSSIFNSETSKKNPTKKQTNPKPNEDTFAGIVSFLMIVVLVFAFKSSVLDANNIPSGSMIPTLKIGDFLFVNKMRYSFRIPFTDTELIRYDDPKRGDIITFIPPADAVRGESRSGIFAKRFVKRVVGLPGDTIRITRKFIDSPTRDRVLLAYFEYKPKGEAEFQSFSPEEVPIGDELSDLDNTKASSRALFIEQKPGFQHYMLEGYEDSPLLNYCDFKEGCVIPDNHYMAMGDNRDDSFDSRSWGFVPREDILGKALVIYFSINWKDSTCEFKSGKELAEKGDIFAERYSPTEIASRCHPDEIRYSVHSGDEDRYEESRLGWLERTFRYRLWRLDVRWDRVGRILK
ncbi:signal peptidase I [Leptospira idonii]|uniref:Signal peptidase I n=1 Tax=Leptospira idonii TaxID=1193500 RepID=A0A4R9M483_9LEPT|nr:signal peptidase I [Leptospira idonii]TGN20675.1 signal peptidase I [Leptospira idonii]